ncbi:hypothetical protein [Flavobacterium rhizosphaerae]|uniref:Uncharacterized protein n=1 Tax=Flavobacterium rhizosphaerae TaxID=3163298 RepID=A0ABW8YVT2_9FLAO
MLETLAGKKKTTVNRLNETLKLDWLSQRNIEYLKTFRNEFEYYQGDGTFSFDFKKDIALCTKNTDSLEAILFENHINVS